MLLMCGAFSKQSQHPNLLVNCVFWAEEFIPGAATAAHLWGNTSISVRNHMFLQKISSFSDTSTAGQGHVQTVLVAGVATLGWCWDLGFCACSCPLAGLGEPALLLKSTWCVLSFAHSITFVLGFQFQFLVFQPKFLKVFFFFFPYNISSEFSGTD